MSPDVAPVIVVGSVIAFLGCFRESPSPIRRIGRAHLAYFLVASLLIYELTLALSTVVWRLHGRDPIVLSSVVAVVMMALWEALLHRPEREDPPSQEDSPPNDASQDHQELYEYSRLRKWRAEMNWLFNALHETRCLLRMFDWDVSIKGKGHWRPFGPTNYCGPTLEGGISTRCGRNEGRWWWPGFCFFHKCKKWEEHIEDYKAAKQEKKSVEQDRKFDSSRLDFLASALTVVDTKCGSLMQFNGMVLAATTFLLARPSLQGWEPPTRIKVWAGLWLVSWAWTIYLCLRSQSDVVWSDPVDATTEHFVVAERIWTREVIAHLVMRTARLRVAVASTALSLLLLAFVITLTIWYPRRAENDVASGTAGPLVLYDGYRVTFSEGEACTSDDGMPPLERVGRSGITPLSLEMLASEIRGSTYRTLQITGSATIQPLGSRARGLYGNNAGLALERARCVARVVQSQLAAQTLYVRTDVTVRAPGNHAKAVKDDRVVNILLVP